MLKVDDVVLNPFKAVILDDIAIIADLHLGYENVLQNTGISIPTVQIEEILEDVKKLIEVGVNTLVINGDVKHEFSQNLPVEWKDVKALLSMVTERVEKTVIVRGNHDNFLPSIVRKYRNVNMVDVFEIGDYAVFHGHINVKFDAETMIMAHEHPAIKLRDEIGGSYKYSCFIRFDEILVIPAFSPLMRGTDIISSPEFMSPLLRERDVELAEVYAIEDDIVPLGTVAEIKRALL